MSQSALEYGEGHNSVHKFYHHDAGSRKIVLDHAGSLAGQIS